MAVTLQIINLIAFISNISDNCPHIDRANINKTGKSQ